MTLMYAGQKPLPSSPFQLSGDVYVTKWMHSIWKDPDSQTEWSAIETARSLAFELGVYDGIHYADTRTSAFSTRPSLQGRNVGFAPEVDVLVGMDENLTMFCEKVPDICMDQQLMPWSAKHVGKRIYKGQLIDLCQYHNFDSFEEPLSPCVAVSIPRNHSQFPFSDDFKLNRDEDPQLMDPSDPSSAEEDRPRRARDPRRPPIRLMPSWIAELWDLLQQEGATEMAEEGPVLYLQSYYLSHQRHPQQRESRPLRIDRDYVDWEDEFRQVWQDFVDPAAPLSVYIELSNQNYQCPSPEGL
eukprot:s1557_g6.t1